MTAQRFELTPQRQKVSSSPTEPPGRPVCVCLKEKSYMFVFCVNTDGSTRFSLSVEDEQAGAGRDGRTWTSFLGANEDREISNLPRQLTTYRSARPYVTTITTVHTIELYVPVQNTVTFRGEQERTLPCYSIQTVEQASVAAGTHNTVYYNKKRPQKLRL